MQLLLFSLLSGLPKDPLISEFIHILLHSIAQKGLTFVQTVGFTAHSTATVIQGRDLGFNVSSERLYGSLKRVPEILSSACPDSIPRPLDL